jgi:hypothetical protein
MCHTDCLKRDANLLRLVKLCGGLVTLLRTVELDGLLSPLETSLLKGAALILSKIKEEEGIED